MYPFLLLKSNYVNLGNKNITLNVLVLEFVYEVFSWSIDQKDKCIYMYMQKHGDDRFN